MPEKQYIRADIDIKVVKCRNCRKEIIRRDLRQIVYYCSAECRRIWRDKQ
jgi:hypothetical protein